VIVKPALRDVTVCAVDCLCPTLAARALRESLAACDFGDAILFTDAPMAGDGFRVVPIAPLASFEAYSEFILKSLARHLSTAYVLVVQWDGYVVDGDAWSAELLQFDYVGAPWPWHKDGMSVGNGGFSLRSRKLMEAMASDRFALVPNLPEDHQICRHYRKRLEAEFGIRYAPEALASRFSYERALPTRSTFGFHGIFNFWRHVGVADAARLAPDLPDKAARSIELVELLAQYVYLRQFKPFEAYYARVRRSRPMAEVTSDARKFLQDPRMLVLFEATCERAEEARATTP
jgi:hypothetical protein